MENDKAELAKYIFMGWLDEFIRPRKTKSFIEFIQTNKSPVLLTSRDKDSDIEDNSNDQYGDSHCDSPFDQQLLNIQLLKLLAN